jgi:hypothetical protein
MKSVAAAAAAIGVLTCSGALAATFGVEDFLLDQQVRNPRRQTTDTFFGAGTQRDLLCSNPQSTACLTVIQGGVWRTTVRSTETFTQALVNEYVPPFDFGSDLTQGGTVEAFELRLRSTGISYFGLSFDKYDPTIPGNVSKPVASYNSPGINTNGQWQAILLPFSDFDLLSGASNYQEVFSLMLPAGWPPRRSAEGRQCEVDRGRSGPCWCP